MQLHVDFREDLARVELRIAHSNRDESKRVFDFVHKRREEIEARFENALDWDN